MLPFLWSNRIASRGGIRIRRGPALKSRYAKSDLGPHTPTSSFVRIPLKLALAHHWLVGMRGGEKVLESLAGLFPGVPIYTLVASKAGIHGGLRNHVWSCSPLQRLPGAILFYKKLLPLFPLAISRLKVDSNVKFLISSDASVIKGLQCPKSIPHVCYCHSPPRYLWDLAGETNAAPKQEMPSDASSFEL